MRVARFDRADFLATRFGYRPGQHVSLIEPTQGGKTTLIFQLLDSIGEQPNPPVMLIAKPRDPTVSEEIEARGYRELSSWPPKRRWWQDTPPGYALWPRHIKGDIPGTKAHLADQFRRCMVDQFYRGDSIVVADEVYHLAVVLGLQEELTYHWTQGAGMGAALWSATQKPSGTQQGSIPTFMYSAAFHTFLGRDNEERNRRRFSEIGGVDSKMVAEETLRLGQFEKLYINRTGPTFAVISA